MTSCVHGRLGRTQADVKTQYQPTLAEAQGSVAEFVAITLLRLSR